MEDFIYIYLRILPYAVLFHMQGQPLDTKIYRNINSMYYPLLSYCSTSFWKCRGCPFQALLLLAPRLEDAIFILQRLLISLVGPDWGLQFIPLNFQCVANLRETASWSDLIVIWGIFILNFVLWGDSWCGPLYLVLLTGELRKEDLEPWTQWVANQIHVDLYRIQLGREASCGLEASS